MASTASYSTASKRTWVDLTGCIASVIDASAFLIFQLFLTTPGTAPRFWIMLLVDPITCIIGYWVLRFSGTEWFRELWVVHGSRHHGYDFESGLVLAAGRNFS